MKSYYESVLPHPQWTLRGCLVHRTHLHHPHHIPLAEQIHSWFAGKGPKVCTLPCTQGCRAGKIQAIHIHVLKVHSLSPISAHSLTLIFYLLIHRIFFTL